MLIIYKSLGSKIQDEVLLTCFIKYLVLQTHLSHSTLADK